MGLSQRISHINRASSCAPPLDLRSNMPRMFLDLRYLCNQVCIELPWVYKGCLSEKTSPERGRGFGDWGRTLVGGRVLFSGVFLIQRLRGRCCLRGLCSSGGRKGDRGACPPLQVEPQLGEGKQSTCSPALRS